MRAVSIIVSVLLAGSAFAQDSAAVYTPTQRDVDVPTYVNATVVRVDTRHDTITFRSESGEVSLTVEGDAVAGLRRLRPGDEVLVGYRVDDRTGRPVQIVTAILAGEEMAQSGFVSTSTAASTSSSFSTVSGRVIGADPAAGTLTLLDAEGRTERLSVQGATALSALAAVSPGDQVDVSLLPASAPFAGGGVVAGVPIVGGAFGTVNAIQPVATPNFVTGRVTTIDNNTGALTLRTAFGDQVFMLPPAGAGRLVAGQDVRLDLNGRSFTTSTPLAVTGTTATAGISGSDNRRSLTGTTGTLRSTRTSATVNTTRGTFATPHGSGPGSPNTSGRTGMVQTTSAPRTATTRMLGADNTQSRGTVTNFGSESGTVGSVTTATGTVGGVNTVAGRTAVGSTGQVAGAPTTTATVAGTTGSASSLNAGAPTTPLGTLAGAGTVNGGVGTTTTNTLAGSAAVNGLAGVNGVSNVAGQAGTGTPSSPGVSTGTDNLAPGTFTAAASPFASQVPSLPSVVGQLNVVPPPTAAPVLPGELPVGAARDVATRDYDNAVRTMALKANEIDAHWFRYRDGCLRSNAVTAEIDRNFYSPGRDREWFVLFTGDVRSAADDNCRQLLIEMTRMANDWRDSMTRVEETARKNDVLPGAMREARQRYRVEF